MPRISKKVREDAALACMAVAAIRLADGSERSEEARTYGTHLADIALDEIVGAEAAELAQRARDDYAVAASHAFFNLWPVGDVDEFDDAERKEMAEDNRRNKATADGLRWAEAAALILDGWSPWEPR